MAQELREERAPRVEIVPHPTHQSVEHLQGKYENVSIDEYEREKPMCVNTNQRMN